MSAFQLVGLLITSTAVIVSISSILRGRGRFVVSSLWIIIWCTSAVFIAQPQMTAMVARLMGIGRGADLVFYFNVLLTLMGFFIIYLRQRRIERHLTLLTRELALSNPIEPEVKKLVGTRDSNEQI